MGDPVTIIDGLDLFCDDLLNSKNLNPWKNSTEKLSGNSLVIPMNKEIEQFGACLGRILGLKLHEGYLQHSKRSYFIERHNHDNDLAAIYALFYLWNDGNPGYINLFEKDDKIERKTGRIIVIPKNRYHSVDPIPGENKFIRYVFTKERPASNNLDKNTLEIMKSKIKFAQV